MYAPAKKKGKKMLHYNNIVIHAVSVMLKSDPQALTVDEMSARDQESHTIMEIDSDKALGNLSIYNAIIIIIIIVSYNSSTL